MPYDPDQLSDYKGWRLVRSGAFWRAFGSLLASLGFFEWTAQREYWNRVRRENDEPGDERE